MLASFEEGRGSKRGEVVSLITFHLSIAGIVLSCVVMSDDHREYSSPADHQAAQPQQLYKLLTIANNSTGHCYALYPGHASELLESFSIFLPDNPSQYIDKLAYR
jgi:hypothetical protein